MVRRPPHRRQIVHQRAGPVENDVTDHGPELTVGNAPGNSQTAVQHEF
jgi:hypothetical protein